MSVGEPYRSTVHFCRFVKRHIRRTPGSIMQVAGRNDKDLIYITREFPESSIVEMEAGNENALVARGYCKVDSRSTDIIEGDWIQPDNRLNRTFDGVIALYWLSEVPCLDAGVQYLCSLTKEWVATSVLLWQGSNDFIIRACPARVRPESSPVTNGVYYNIYSLRTLSACFYKSGFDEVHAEPFKIDVDIPRPDVPRLGTYTVRTADGCRLQVSGPLLMPWWFVFARRNEVASHKEMDSGIVV